jgi:hypothetical protein
MTLPDHIRFVRSNGGSGSYPISRKGWAVGAGFAAGMAMSALLAPAFGGWLGMTLFTLGAAASAAWFIFTARRHTDFSITVSDYLKVKNNA